MEDQGLAPVVASNAKTPPSAVVPGQAAYTTPLATAGEESVPAPAMPVGPGLRQTMAPVAAFRS